MKLHHFPRSPSFERLGARPPLSGVLAYRYEQSLHRCITCQDVCVSVATDFFAKITRWTKKFTRFEKNHWVKISALKLTVLLEIIYLCILSPKNL